MMPVLSVPASLGLGLFLDALLGDPVCRLHPVRLMGSLALWLEPRVRQKIRRERIAGTLCTLAVILVFAVVAGLTTWGAALLHPLAEVSLAGIWIYTTIASRDLATHALSVADTLEQDGLPAGRLVVSRMVGRDPEVLDETGVVRACIESVGENMVDGITSAIFWACIGGVAFGPIGAASLAVACRAINTLDATYGYRNDRYRYFGTFAARLDDALHYLPARLTWPAVVGATALMGERTQGVLCISWRDHGCHASPNSGWGEASMAGALGVRLGGPTAYRDGVKEYPYIGDEKEPLQIPHIRRAVRMMQAVSWLFACAAAIVTSACIYAWGGYLYG